MKKQLLIIALFLFTASTIYCQVNTIKYQYNAVGTRTNRAPNVSNTASQWMATGNTRCAKNSSNNNTGNTECEERDNNTNSVTHNQTRWVVTGYNTTSCPLPTPASVSVTLKNYFIATVPSPMTVEFMQGSKVIRTKNFSATQTGSAFISVPVGLYQLRITVPTSFQNTFISFSLGTLGWWDKSETSQTVVITETLSFNTGSTYTLMAGDAM